MKTHIAVAARRPGHIISGKKPEEQGGAAKKRALQLLAALFLAGLLALWWQTTRLQKQFVESVALDHARTHVQTLKELGSVYTTETGTRTKAVGAGSAPDSKKKTHMFSTFTSLLTKAGDSVEGGSTEVRKQFYPMDPSTGQLKGNKVQAGFIGESWASLKKNPDHTLSRFEKVEGQRVLRYVTGWKEGGAQGILEIQVPLDKLMSGSGSFCRTLLGLFGGAGVLVGCLLSILLRGSRREAKTSELRGAALESKLTEQEKTIHALELEAEERKRQQMEVLSATNVVTAVTGELLKATSELASSATEMAAAVNETTATVEEVKQTATLSSQKAQQVSVVAQQAAQISQTGKQATEHTVTEMQRIHDQMQLIAESILRLSEQSQIIREIIDTVNDLAEQSNVLAVNAAIEAQKAGAHGSGFVVVAQEVRTLAQQSKEATIQVRSILNDIEKATGAAVQITTQGSRAAEAGMKQSVEAGESIRTLAQSVHEAAQSAALIATSNQQQAIGVDQLLHAMHNIQEGSARTVTGMQQVEACVRRLQELRQRLHTLGDALAGGEQVRILSESVPVADAA